MTFRSPLGGGRSLGPHAVALVLALFIVTPTCAAPEDERRAEDERPAEDDRESNGGAFEEWLAELEGEALAHGISQATLDAALDDTRVLDRVLDLDRDQPEFTLELDRYLERTVTSKRLARGRRALADHRRLLDRVSREFNVQPRFIVALWGIESNYGGTPGSFDVIDALATLAFDGRRSAFFRGELMKALEILDQGHTDAASLRGSWAGATGQTQFMPSSFLAHAVDFDGDGRRDIWTSTADVLASIANYLASHGWKDDQTWGRPVRLPRGFDPSLIGRKVTKSLPEWQRLGVRRADGGALPARSLPASIVKPDPNGRAYLVYDNFKTLMRWNGSEAFGIAVGSLADRLASN